MTNPPNPNNQDQNKNTDQNQSLKPRIVPKEETVLPATNDHKESDHPKNLSSSQDSERVQSSVGEPIAETETPSNPQDSDQETEQKQNIELEEEVKTLKQDLEKKEEYIQKLLRSLAEKENTRKREQRENQENFKFAISRFAYAVLDISDSLQLALESIDSSQDDPLVHQLAEGLSVIQRQLDNVFDRFAIKKMTPLGKPFDPYFHEVMFEISDLEQPAGTVVQILKAGYMLHDRLLRAAAVSIVKARDHTPEDNPDNPEVLEEVSENPEEATKFEPTETTAVKSENTEEEGDEPSALKEYKKEE